VIGSATMFSVSVAAKLQLRPGSTVAVLGMPENIELELPQSTRSNATPASADAVIAFALASAAVETVAAAAMAAAREDRLAWIAYPKAGNLGTDLNRDTHEQSQELYIATGA
jgi:hypothetical protein